MWEKFESALFRPVDNSSLIVFRILFGFLITAEAWGAIATGWVKEVFVDTTYTFTFIGFEWLRVLHGEAMYAFYVVMGLFGVMVMLGFKYRLAIVAFTLMWTATYLVQKTNYNNHYYLLILLSAFMAIVPAERSKSVDARLKPGIRTGYCPQWCYWIFIAQMAIVYTFASLAKMYPDWINALPIEIWFRAKRNYFLIGPVLQEKWLQHLVAYGGIAFDGLIIPALLWQRTRKWAFILSIFFHLFNSAVFQVGVFPYMALALSVFFFPPSTIRKIFFRGADRDTTKIQSESAGLWVAGRRLFVGMLVLYFALQIYLPLRRLHYKGDSNWTEEGHKMGWRMMLRAKSGSIDFLVVDKITGDSLKISPRQDVTFQQVMVIATRPDITWQYIQELKKRLALEGHPEVSIYANSMASLNGRPRKPLIKPNVDLAGVRWLRFKHSEWLTTEAAEF